uniref:Uncharacterized protein n=1 Tax=viral metagenome TaxID=1070528 RepID=A0A6C0IFR5_9ZZZZ
MSFYGFNFTERNCGGLGAMIHDVTMACVYAEQNNLQLCFVKEGYDIPRFNGSIDDTDVPNKTWHSYFNSFPIVEKKDCIECWPKYLPETTKADCDIEKFSNLLKEKICDFKPEIYDEINNLVKKTPFNAETDIVVHIRQTDKIIENFAFLPIENYINECEYALKELGDKKNRIYICTDDSKVCSEIQDYFSIKNVEVVWDTTESKDALHVIRTKNNLTKSLAQQETMNAFKNIFIMKNTKYLIGGRMSYFFRIAELLRYPNKSINIQDNGIFGVAQYSSEKYLIRPYSKKAIPDFINKYYIKNKEVIKMYNKIYNEENIITIPKFISLSVLKDIREDIENYKWWHHAMIPDNNIWKVKYEKKISDKNIEECNKNLIQKNFTYRFMRSLNHYETCSCVSCKMIETVKCFHVTDLLCQIIGCKNIRPGEIFFSNYGKDDFLSIHHDKNKGDIAVTFSLSYDWHPTYGGILHFCDEYKNIYKSVVPTLGSVNIFKLDPNKGIDHFVSCVNVDKNRYTLTAWYYIIN